ncbi:MAG: PorV/PorQ family protein [Caldithrix sp.]|nr:PorV/PorQ family protein [Caldithrix sp.]
MIKRTIAIWVVMLFLAMPLKAQEFAPVGSAVSQFLEIGMGARAIAMGEAYTAVTNDAGAAFWNPAGLVDIEKRNFYLAYNQWPADISLGGISMAMNLGNMGTIGVSGIFLNTDDMEVTTVDAPQGTGETFGISNYAAGISYSRFLTNRLSVGVTGKIVHEGYMDYDYTTWAVDIGTVYRTEFRNMRIGMSILHFGPEVQFNGDFIDFSDPRSVDVDEPKSFQTYSLPVNFRIGFNIDVWRAGRNGIITAMDMVHSNNNLETYNWGLEYSFSEMVFLRGGYRLNLDEGGLTLGAGARFNWFAENDAHIDYAFSDRGVVANIHRFSLGVSF